MAELSRFRWRGAGDDITSAELLRECGRKLTDAALWEKFQTRFQKLIFGYVLRGLNYRTASQDGSELVNDLVQDVYMRLVQNDGRMLRAFKGDTDFSVMAFLSRVSMSAVTDYHRYQTANKRQAAEVISIDDARRASGALKGEAVELDFASILGWIDIERLVDSDMDRKHATRNVLIFKLYYVNGFTPAEIAQFPGFQLTASGIEIVLQRLKARLQKRIGKQ
jgi:RNA polymerase sigma factor (sigma-70 family)